jgi:hypothetical protein
LRLALALAWTVSCGLATLAFGATRTLQDCRAIADDKERLACYDAAAAASPAPANAAPANAAPVSAAVASAATASNATEAPGKKSSGEEDFGKQRTDAEKAAPQDLRSAVASVETDANGKLILALDNGQTWAQIDSPSLKLKAGDEVVIRRGSLGSYLLARAVGGPEIRVRRR